MPHIISTPFFLNNYRLSDHDTITICNPCLTREASIEKSSAPPFIPLNCRIRVTAIKSIIHHGGLMFVNGSDYAWGDE